MHRPATGLVAATVVALIAGGTTVVAVRQCSPQPAVSLKLPLASGGVKLTRITDGKKRDRGALGGDWLLSSDVLRIAVGADVPGVERQLRYGAIVEIGSMGLNTDQALEIRPALEVAGRPVALRVDKIEAVAARPRPILRIKQVSREGLLVLETDLLLSAGKPWLELATRVTNESAQRVQGVSVGDRSRWPGALVFAPRLGFVKAPLRRQTQWFARVGGDLTYAFAFPSGAADVSFAFDRVGPSEQKSMPEPVDLAPGATQVFRRFIIATPGGIERAAELCWGVEQRPLGRVMGRLLPAPSWATVTALHPDGRPVLSVRANRVGHFELPLPAGDYRLVLDSPGGSDEQEPVSVVPGQQVEAALMPPEPGKLRYSVTDREGVLLPARYIVRGIAPTPNPNFGPAERSEGAANFFYTRSGQGQVELPPGAYRITATRGTEYSTFEHEVTLTSDKGATVRSVLDRVVDTAGWLACDFHLHASPSPDSSVSLDDRVVSLLAEGVEFAVPTDHNHVTDYAPVIERFQSFPLLGTTPGVEITTRSWGHFIAFPYPKDAPPPPYSAADPGELFAATRQRMPHGVLQVNHPRMPGIGYFNRGEVDAVAGTAATEGFSFDFDTVEVINGFELGQPSVIVSNIAEWFNLLNAGRRFTGVANSDSHRLVYQWAGYPRTYVRVQNDRPDAVSPQEVADSLRAGRAIMTNGPFVNARVNRVAEPGDLITSDEPVINLEVLVRAPEWVDVRRADVIVNGRVAATTRARAGSEGPRIQWQTQLRLEKDSWIVVQAKGEKSLEPVIPGNVTPIALTNPIFVDVDGDGVFTPPAPVQGVSPKAPASAAHKR